MNERSYLYPKKKPVTGRLGRVGDAAGAIFRVLCSNVYEEDASSPPSPWTRNYGTDAPASLLPVRIPISRRRY